MKLFEVFEIIKFKYNKKTPKVKVLDFNYKGNDVLGWNLNYSKRKRYTQNSLDNTSNFSDLVGDDQKNKYDRIRNLFPEQKDLIRRYKRKKMENIKIKKGRKWVDF